MRVTGRICPQCSGTELAHVRLFLTSSLSPAGVLQIYLRPIKVNRKVVPESRLLLFPLFWGLGKEEEICRGATSKLSGIENSCCITPDTILATARERCLLKSVAACWRPNKC